MINSVAQKYINSITEISQRIKPLVVITTITYNHEPYIRDALEGFVMQKTSFPFVAIVHDDCSTDGTASILREYAEKYPDIILPIFENENQYSKHDGSLSDIIIAARESTGAKYIALCEGDDYWIDPLKLQKQVDFLESHPDYGMCYTNFNIKNEIKNTYTKDLFDNCKEIFQKEFNSPEEFILKKKYVCPPSWIFKRELLPTDLISSLDGTFVMFTHFLCNTKIKYIPITTAVYRILSESASHSKSHEKILKRTKNLFETQIALIKKYNLDVSIIPKCEISYYRENLYYFIICNLKNEVERANQLIKRPNFKVSIYMLFYRLHAKSLLKFIHELKPTKF